MKVLPQDSDLVTAVGRVHQHLVVGDSLVEPGMTDMLVLRIGNGVTGGEPAGTGGKQESFDRARPILEMLSAKLRYIGEAGQAARVKALVNMVMNINTAGLAEGLGLGVALGLDLTMLQEVFSQTGAASRVLETDGADMQNRDHECYFSAAHAAKDSGIAYAMAESVGLPLPLAKSTWEQYQRLMASGKGELDKSAIAELTFKDRRDPVT